MCKEWQRIVILANIFTEYAKVMEVITFTGNKICNKLLSKVMLPTLFRGKKIVSLLCHLPLPH